jgi:hypothetical protein
VSDQRAGSLILTLTSLSLLMGAVSFCVVNVNRAQSARYLFPLDPILLQAGTSCFRTLYANQRVLLRWSFSKNSAQILKQSDNYFLLISLWVLSGPEPLSSCRACCSLLFVSIQIQSRLRSWPHGQLANSHREEPVR